MPRVARELAQLALSYPLALLNHAATANPIARHTHAAAPNNQAIAIRSTVGDWFVFPTLSASTR